jgi:hypothetical protein
MATTAVGASPAGFAAFSRAFVAVTAELVESAARRVVGEQRVRTARGNAWAAMCEDRARAQARAEMDVLVQTLVAKSLTEPATASRRSPTRRLPAPA